MVKVHILWLLLLFLRRAADEHMPSAALHSVHINLNTFQSTQTVFVPAVTLIGYHAFNLITTLCVKVSET